jgi:outer membrane lipoprotein-sorting protein
VEPNAMTFAFRLLILIVCAAAPLRSFAADNLLDTAFARIDKGAATFKGMTADMKRLHHVELVSSDELQEGTIVVKKVKAGDIRLLITFVKPDPQVVSIGAGKVQSYNPKIKEVQEIDVRKHKDLINEVLLLGFGGTSAELKGLYTITPGAAETINGVSTVRIQLIPLSEEIRRQIKKCELWIPENGIPVQQKFYETGGDYQIATYSKIVLGPVQESAIKLDLPKGVKVTKVDK